MSDAETETYLDSHGYINALVFRFVRKFGGDYDDLRSESNISFIMAFRRHKPEKLPFSAYLRKVVNDRLYDDLRKRLSRLDKAKFHSLEIDPSEESRFNIVDFLDGLSLDAKVVVKVVLDFSYFTEKEEAKNRSPKQMLIKFLEEHLHWTNEQIVDAFREIKKALT